MNNPDDDDFGLAPEVSGSSRVTIRKKNEDISISDTLKEINARITALTSKIDKILIDQSDIKRDIIMIRRALPNIQTSGPTDNFRVAYDKHPN